MRRFFSTILLAFFSCLSFAQNSIIIEGNVKNEEGKVIPNASVYLLNTQLGNTTDKDGHFQIQLSQTGKYTIQISAIGYSSRARVIRVPQEGLNNLDFTLSSAETSLGTVMVTAEKREQEAQDIPASITTLTAKDVEDFRLWNIQDLTSIAPNFHSSNSGDNRNVTFIRGVGTTSYNQAVATYVDGVNQFTLDSYLADLMDIERIEILRGPQGTLYGRNAMGGVINIITKKPTNTTRGFAEVNYGNHNQQRFGAGIKTPLVKNKLFLGVTAFYNSRDGYYKNLFNNHSFEDQRAYTGEYFLKYQPSDTWDISLNVRHQINRNKGAFPLSGSIADAHNQPFELNQNALTTMVDNTQFSSLSISHHGSGFIFSSQTAYQSNKRIYRNPIDGDFSPMDIITIVNDYGGHFNRVNTWTQEFRFSSPASSNGKFQWTAGSYLFLDKEPDKQGTHFGEDAGAAYGLPDVNFTTINTTFGNNRGIAFYGQATYSLTDQLDFTAGLRYDYEHKRLAGFSEYQKDGGQPMTTLADTSARASYNAFSPKASLAWHLSDNNMLYGTYSRGFRTGGFTELSSDPSEPPLRAFKPEYSNNFEIGSKNNFFHHKLRANLTLFLTKVTDIQIPTLILPDAITVTRNAGKMESKGVELELSSTPVKGLQLDYNFGYTHARYTKLDLASNGGTKNLKGNKQIYTPDYTSMLAAQYSFFADRKKNVRLFVRGEWSALGKQYFDLPNTVSQNAYDLLNTRLGIDYKAFELSFWGRNLTDKHYVAYAYDFPPNPAHLGDPRTIGVGLKYDF